MACSTRLFFLALEKIGSQAYRGTAAQGSLRRTSAILLLTCRRRTSRRRTRYRRAELRHQLPPRQRRLQPLQHRQPQVRQRPRLLQHRRLDRDLRQHQGLVQRRLLVRERQLIVDIAQPGSARPRLRVFCTVERGALRRLTSVR